MIMRESNTLGLLFTAGADNARLAKHTAAAASRLVVVFILFGGEGGRKADLGSMECIIWRIRKARE